MEHAHQPGQEDVDVADDLEGGGRGREEERERGREDVKEHT